MRLLANPAYARHMADIWQRFWCRETQTMCDCNEPFEKWLEQSFKENKHWNVLVSDLLTASGVQEKNGAVTFFIAQQTADKMTDTVSKVFLGVQLQCAQCHNHPFTHWKQTEYWGMAAFFTKVRADNAKKADKMGNSPGVTEGPGRGKGQKLPESAKIVPAKFFQGEQPKINNSDPHRPVLAKWLTSAENPFFARAMVNRMWQQFFGRGIVNPVDDMHEGNAASHPEVLQKLAEQFAAHDFDLHYLIRAICLSQTYQRSSRPTEGNESDEALFSHMAIKALSPEQLFDSLTAIVGTDSRDERPRRPLPWAREWPGIGGHNSWLSSRPKMVLHPPSIFRVFPRSCA